ncbi:MAG: hypothetical protein A2045_00160 [Rhodocyclales bacterium GWA2_65_20]|nr:MAG: hypothetical protein A2045_00160 [Rhodocyclales bacterium GWA2_65_20]
METPFLIKAGVVAAMLAILASLGMALVRLIKDRGQTTRTVRALTLRIGISILLFILLLVGVFTGIVVPHGVTP